MKVFRCEACGVEQAAPLPPRVCANCRATGAGMRLVSSIGNQPASSEAKTVDGDRAPANVASILSAPLRRRTATPLVSTPVVLTPPPRVDSIAEPKAASPAATLANERVIAIVPLASRATTPKPLRHGAIVDAAGRLVVSSRNRVAAISIEGADCRTVWMSELDGSVSSAPAISSDGMSRCHADDGKLHYLDADGKRCRPPVVVGSPLAHAGPVVDTEGVTWICRHDGGLLRVDAEGEASVFFRSRQRFDCVPLLHEGRLYVGAGDNFIHAIGLSGRRGESLWDHKAGCGEVAWYVNARPAALGSTSILAACRDSANQLYAFDLEGRPQWSASMPGMMLGAPAVNKDGEVFLAVSVGERGQADRGALVCFDSRSRSVRWTYEIDAAAESTPVIDQHGVVYFGDVAGNVHAVSAEGRALWITSVGSAIRSEGTIVGACVAFVTDDHSVVVLRRD